MPNKFCVTDPEKTQRPEVLGLRRSLDTMIADNAQLQLIADSSPRHLTRTPCNIVPVIGENFPHVLRAG